MKEVKSPQIAQIGEPSKRCQLIDSIDYISMTSDQFEGMIATGHFPRAETRKDLRKLSKSDVFNILSSKEPSYKIAELYNVSSATICHIRKGKSYVKYFIEFKKQAS